MDKLTVIGFLVVVGFVLSTYLYWKLLGWTYMVALGIALIGVALATSYFVMVTETKDKI